MVTPIPVPLYLHHYENNDMPNKMKHAAPLYVIDSGSPGAPAYRVITLDSKSSLLPKRRFTTVSDLHLDIVQRLNMTATVSSLLPPAVEVPIIENLFGETRFVHVEQDLHSIKELADSMYGLRRDSNIPSGYTYLSQFVAHELCRSSRISASSPAFNEVTFSFDLDSIYQCVPTDDLYLRLGETTRNTPFDIPREAHGLPTIGNNKNDANLILSQLHCAILRFHNEIASCGFFSTFDEIKRQVILSVQSIIIYDWLPKITSRMLVDSILTGTRYSPVGSLARCPSEAVLAAFRCVHSMVRPRYQPWNNSHPIAEFSQLLHLTSDGGGLPITLGVRKLPWDWVIDWNAFFDFGQDPPPQVARAIDTTIEDAMATLPVFVLNTETNVRSLAFRSLWFGAEADLLDGWSIQDMLSRAVGMDEFPLIGGEDRVESALGHLVYSDGTKFSERPPLWWFTLFEAQQERGKGGLRGVGARIVAETTIAAIEASAVSLLKGETIHRSLPGGGEIAPTVQNMLTAFGQDPNWSVQAF
jgi:hypothetical protein